MSMVNPDLSSIGFIHLAALLEIYFCTFEKRLIQINKCISSNNVPWKIFHKGNKLD